MKKSSMKTAPNGRTPPTRALNQGDMYQGCGGTCLGILFVLTGVSGGVVLNPK